MKPTEGSSVHMKPIKTVTLLVASLLLDHFRTQRRGFLAIEFDQDEVLLSDAAGSVIRVARTGPRMGEIAVECGGDEIRQQVAGDEVQSYAQFFELPML